MPTIEMPIVSPETDLRATDLIRGRVARGAQLLDDNIPGWRDSIDKRRLNLCDAHGCILGQLHDEGPFATQSGYAIGSKNLGLWDEELVVNGRLIPATVHFGFNALHPWEYPYLLREWLRLLP